VADLFDRGVAHADIAAIFAARGRQDAAMSPLVSLLRMHRMYHGLDSSFLLPSTPMATGRILWCHWRTWNPMACYRVADDRSILLPCLAWLDRERKGCQKEGETAL